MSENAAKILSEESEEIPKYVSDVGLFFIGVGWVIFCFFIFKFVSYCSKSSGKKNEDN